ncbi:MAG: redoxin domain-containing protein [bacterium]|nr:redoxin domain-containing protein [bacterium]
MSQSEQSVKLKVGDPAPDFTLLSHNEGELNLAWYQGRKNVMLAFYPGDWTPVCTAQIPGYQAEIERFEEMQCQVMALSVDSVPCHRAWAKSVGSLSFPLMADYYPHGKVAALYGVLNPRGYAERSVFLIDKQGIIQYIEYPETNALPNQEELFKQLEHLNKQSV